jgi:hypothetical protein
MVYQCKTRLFDQSGWNDGKIDLELFHSTNENENEVYGWYIGVHISILKESINVFEKGNSSFI